MIELGRNSDLVKSNVSHITNFLDLATGQL